MIKFHSLLEIQKDFSNNQMLSLVSFSIFFIYLFSAMGLALFGYNCYYYLFIFLKHRRRKASANRRFWKRFYSRYPVEKWPIVTTQIPLYNERHVARRIIQVVAAMDYPPEKHEIQILDDSTDETSDIVHETVKTCRQKGIRIRHLRRNHRENYKAGALQAGLESARGEFLAIFDSDFLPPRNFLLKTIPFLIAEKSLGLVQTRWGHLNERRSLFTQAVSIGIDGHFVIEQSARSWGKLFMNFNGTAGVWRKQAIVSAGGWQGDTLTEDMDLSYRAQLKGWKAEFLYEVVCQAEIPEDVNAFKTQQFRWAKGSTQTAIKLLPSIFRSSFSFKKKIQAALHLTHYAIHPLVLLMMITSLPLLLFSVFLRLNPLIFSLFVILLLGSLLAPSVMYAVSQWSAYSNWKSRILMIPFLVCVGTGIAVNNTGAVLSALLGKKGVFVRTPKTGSVGTGKGKPRRKYRAEFKKNIYLEIGLALYCIASFLCYLHNGRYLIIGPFLLLYATGFSIIASLSLIQQYAVSQEVET